MSVPQKQNNFVKELYFIYCHNASTASLNTFLQNAKPLVHWTCQPSLSDWSHAGLRAVKHFKLLPLKEKVKHACSINSFCRQ